VTSASRYACGTDIHAAKVPYTSQRIILSTTPLSIPNIFLIRQVRFTFPGTLTAVIASNITDRILLRTGAKFARQIAQTQPLAGALVTELFPGTDVNTDDAWDNYVAQTAGTEFHPSSTCAMLPLSQGGVVDTNLRVYGLTNVRVADSSVFPIQFAAHVRPFYFPSSQAFNHSDSSWLRHMVSRSRLPILYAVNTTTQSRRATQTLLQLGSRNRRARLRLRNLALRASIYLLSPLLRSSLDLFCLRYCRTDYYGTCNMHII